MDSKQNEEEKHEVSDLLPTPNRKMRRIMKSKKKGSKTGNAQLIQPSVRKKSGLDG